MVTKVSYSLLSMPRRSYNYLLHWGMHICVATCDVKNTLHHTENVNNYKAVYIYIQIQFILAYSWLW